MTDHTFTIRLTASGTVRDADGNVLGEVPIEQDMDVTQEQYDEIQRATAELNGTQT